MLWLGVEDLGNKCTLCVAVLMRTLLGSRRDLRRSWAGEALGKRDLGVERNLCVNPRDETSERVKVGDGLDESGHYPETTRSHCKKEPQLLILWQLICRNDQPVTTWPRREAKPFNCGGPYGLHMQGYPTVSHLGLSQGPERLRDQLRQSHRHCLHVPKPPIVC